MLSETASKTLLDAYEIPVTKPLPAASADDAAEVADGLGYPVVLKVRSPDVTHKTDVGGVADGHLHTGGGSRRLRADRGYRRRARNPAGACAGRDRPADGQDAGLRAAAWALGGTRPSAR